MSMTQEAGGTKLPVFSRLTEGIAQSLRARGTPMQRLLCMGMMALLGLAALPGGYYCCQIAMFAVLVRLGFCVPAAFAGTAAGFIAGFLQGEMYLCWQLPAACLLWLFCGFWADRERHAPMALAVFLAVLSYLAATDLNAPLRLISLLLTAAMGAGLSLLYDGAALCVCRQEELGGDTKPLCVLSVCASLCAAAVHLPYGRAIAMALAAYLTMEHAFIGGGAQAVLCGGVLGGVLSLSFGRVEPCAMLLCGGFFAGEIRTDRRLLCALLMCLGMSAAGAVLGGDASALFMVACGAAGAAPFLLLSGRLRAPITGLIEPLTDEEMTQSEAIAVRCAAMIHSWARLYEDTARMMQGLCAQHPQQAMAEQCVDLLHKTSAASHQICERTLSRIRPDDETYRRLRFALVHAGQEEVRAAYALRMDERMEVMLLKPERVAPISLAPLVSRACGAPMRPCVREGALCTQAYFEQVPRFSLEIGAALRSRSGEEVAGDGYVSRALPGGQHVLALSDGMGSGAQAMQQSHAALSLLVESLRAGYTRAQALDVVNALMLMCTGREMYATMDLCVMDLHTGETAFEKLGACASYVVRSGEVRAIGADTLPVGVLPDVESRSLRMTLAPGDVVVMMTDGVCGGYPGGEEALREAIGKLAWLHPQAVGERLIAKCVGEGEAADDMAVLCARVNKTMVE